VISRTGRLASFFGVLFVIFSSIPRPDPSAPPSGDFLFPQIYVCLSTRAMIWPVVSFVTLCFPLKTTPPLLLLDPVLLRAAIGYFQTVLFCLFVFIFWLCSSLWRYYLPFLSSCFVEMYTVPLAHSRSNFLFLCTLTFPHRLALRPPPVCRGTTELGHLSKGFLLF